MSQNRPQPSEPLDSPLDDARRRKGMLFLGLATGALGFSMMLQMGLNDNFLVEVMDVDAYHKGLLEAIRESCGIFAVGILALIAGLREPKIATLTLTVFGVGLGAYAGLEKGSGSFFWLAAFSMVWSQGFHVWVPLPNSMVLAMAEPGKTGKRLGQLQKYGAVGSAMALAVCLAPSAARWLAKENVLGMAGSGLANLHLPLQPMYWVAGVAGIVGAALQDSVLISG